MTDLIAIADISDELPPAFMILDDESCQNITAIFSSDKTKILAIPKIISKAGNGSNAQTPKQFLKLDNQQVCLICGQILKGTTLWAGRSHLQSTHQTYCDYEELCKHNSRWVRETIEEWEKAVKRSTESQEKAAGKRGIAAVFSPVTKQSETDQRELRKIITVAFARGMLPFNFVNNPGIIIIVNICY